MTSETAAMLCPTCKVPRVVPLVMSERQNIEIDYCPNCRGIWLDRGASSTGSSKGAFLSRRHPMLGAKSTIAAGTMATGGNRG